MLYYMKNKRMESVHLYIIRCMENHKIHHLCCTTYKSVFDTPNESVTFTPKIR